jgi:hypothetical protein
MTMFIDIGTGGFGSLFDATNSWIGDFNYAAGDEFRIERTGGVITVYHNDVLMEPTGAGWSSSGDVTKIDVSMENIGTGISWVSLSEAGTGSTRRIKIRIR